MRSFSPPGGMAERGFPFFQNSSKEAGCSSEKPEKDKKKKREGEQVWRQERDKEKVEAG